MIDKVSFSQVGLNINQLEEKGQKASSPQSFGDLLKNYLKSVDQEQKVAEKTVDKFMAGEADVHQVMIALEKADLSFQLMMQIRNKLVEAYQEIMRMQV